MLLLRLQSHMTATRDRHGEARGADEGHRSIVEGGPEREATDLAKSITASAIRMLQTLLILAPFLDQFRSC